MEGSIEGGVNMCVCVCCVCSSHRDVARTIQPTGNGKQGQGPL